MSRRAETAVPGSFIRLPADKRRERVFVTRGDNPFKFFASRFERGQLRLDLFEPRRDLARRALGLRVAREAARGLLLQSPVLVNLKLDGRSLFRVKVCQAH